MEYTSFFQSPRFLNPEYEVNPAQQERGRLGRVPPIRAFQVQTIKLLEQMDAGNPNAACATERFLLSLSENVDYIEIERRRIMEPRIDPRKVSFGALKAMFGLEQYIRSTGLEENLLNLVRMRVSQINGCAYCLDMHSKELRAAGETEQRIYLLDAWRESPFYTEREQAALAWAEAVTLVADGHVPDEVYKQARSQFSAEDLVNLTLAVVTINGWNRMNISLRNVPGTYQPRQYEELIKQMAA